MSPVIIAAAGEAGQDTAAIDGRCVLERLAVGVDRPAIAERHEEVARSKGEACEVVAGAPVLAVSTSVKRVAVRTDRGFGLGRREQVRYGPAGRAGLDEVVSDAGR